MEIKEFDPDHHLNADQIEADFANQILADNQDLLVELSRITSNYAQNGDSPALYVMVRAIMLTLSLAQGTMKNTLAQMQGAMN